MVVHNPNNWHWVDKNCLPWSKTYLENEIVNTSIEEQDLTIIIKNLDSINGDCDVTQRKGKVKCIFDLNLVFAISGTLNEEEFNGTVSIEEFMHDLDDDEYNFIINSSNTSEIKKHLIPVLKSKLMNFQPDLIKAHEKDVQHSSN